ncbi:hypothetical protein [Burkholderia stagnalis]
MSRSTIYSHIKVGTFPHL